MEDRPARACAAMLADGFARVTLAGAEAPSLQRALQASHDYFGRPAREKLRHASEDANHGYRPLGKEYSLSEDRPDLNECFALWSDRIDLIPRHAEAASCTSALLDWRRHLRPLLDGILADVVTHFGEPTVPEYESASYLQVNNYTFSEDRELLQDNHEDGHLITIIHSTGPGLEIFPGGQLMPVTTATDEVIVMPGSVMSELTQHAVPPLYHQVRNHRLSYRQSLMYFVNPSLDKPLYPWTGTSEERSIDLRDVVRSKPAIFGLAHVPTL